MNPSAIPPTSVLTAPTATSGHLVELIEIDPSARTVWERFSADLRHRITVKILSGSVKCLGPGLYSAKVDGVLAIFRHLQGRPEGTVVSVLTPSEQAILW